MCNYNYNFLIRSYELRRPYESVKVQTGAEERPVATGEGNSVELETFKPLSDNSRNQNGFAKADSNGAAPRRMERTGSVASSDAKSSSSSDQSTTRQQVIIVVR